jgi:D-alanyl-D-alanine carboxypeptidase-like protein
MMRLLAMPLAALAVGASIQPLPAPVKTQLSGGYWHAGCPVPLAKLRLITVQHWGFDGKPHTGQLVVNEKAAAPLAGVFRKLYELRFPIRHLQLADMYGPSSAQPTDGDVSGSFECRQAVPSPCTGGTASGHWSNHAYGLAVDINPGENPYVGCGMTRDKKRLSYLDRSNVRPGMVTPAVVAAFRSIGWGWGGSWSGSTKDYMHFSFNGH